MRSRSRRYRKRSRTWSTRWGFVCSIAAAGIEPTAYGRALAKRGLAVFDELIKLAGVEELAFLADPTAGELRIGSTESVAAGLLPAVIERFSRERPCVHLDVAQAVIGTLHYRELPSAASICC